MVKLYRSTFHYKAKNSTSDEFIRSRLRALAERWRRFGCARLHVMLRREGTVINHKRTERIYKEEKLCLKVRKRRKTASLARIELPKATSPNQRWSMDFVSDCLSNGRKIRILPIIDDYSRMALTIEVDTSINGMRVCRTLYTAAEKEGQLPEVITIDNGPEFIGKALDEWAYKRGIKLNFIRPGKPVENAFIESFIGRLRDECLNQHWFTTLDQAREIIEEWRIAYNRERPHSSLNNLTPEEFIQKEEQKPTLQNLEYSNL
jgi:putative transposase